LHRFRIGKFHGRRTGVWQLISATIGNWSRHKDARLGAALAYYSIFSLGPLIIIAIAIAGIVFGQDAVRTEVGSTIRGLLGSLELKPSTGCSKAPAAPAKG
jgi:membrane protein